MARRFETLDYCPTRDAAVVFAGIKVVTSSQVVTAIKWCACARQCEQEHGSLLELPACRLHDAPSREPLRPAKPSPAPSAPIRVAVPADIADLVPGFLHNRRMEAKRLAAAATEHDFALVDRVAQTMVGGGSMFGFDEITAIGRVLRQAAATRNASALADAVASYGLYLSRVQVACGPLAIRQPAEL